MKAFNNAILAEDQLADDITHCHGLREAISYALGLYEDQFCFFEQNGLSQDTLLEFDHYLEYNLDHLDTVGNLSLEDLDFLIPFVFKMGKAYNQLMADSFVKNPNNGGTTAIEYAGYFHPILNYFYAEKAKLYPEPVNELKFEKE